MAKGTGVLRRIVHSVLETHPLVISFGEAGAGSGGWGATIAAIRSQSKELRTRNEVKSKTRQATQS